MIEMWIYFCMKNVKNAMLDYVINEYLNHWRRQLMRRNEQDAKQDANEQVY